MSDEATINRLWSKFLSDNEDLGKCPEIVEATARAVLNEATEKGHDALGFIEADEQAFLDDVAQRARERAGELGVSGLREREDSWAKLYAATQKAVANSR